MAREPMTRVGEKALQDELYRLTHVDRLRIIEDIATAREHGDLKENAEYHAAREQQGFVEGRIMDIEVRLEDSQVIDPKQLNASGRVVFGAIVVVASASRKKNIQYQIVGVDEANVKQGTIAYNTPLAKALLGRSAGDAVVVTIPSGEQKNYTIKTVAYS